MSKIICDVCGTAYPETNARCPICGSANVGAEQTAAGESTPGAEEVSYTYVKGGRFSKRNVRRRGRETSRTREQPAEDTQTQDGEEKTNVALIAVVIILLLAIVAVVIYIGLQFFGPIGDEGTTLPPSTVETTQEPTGNKIPCLSLELSNKTIELSMAGSAWLLEALPTPSNTTDKITFVSGDETVAMVTDTGRVTAVGGGETVITVTCGTIVQECRILCAFEGFLAPTEQPSQAPTQEGSQQPTIGLGPVDADFVFEFNTRYKDQSSGKADTTISTAGGTWRAYKKDMKVKPEEITWTSDDPAIATVSNGIVTGIAPGKTEIHAQYGGKTYTCIVRCSWKSTQSGGEDEKDSGAAATGDVKISDTDVTISVSEVFTLTLKGADGKALEVQWTTSEPAYVSISGNKITGLKAKLAGVKVFCEYEGVTYTCIVRIKG